MIRKSLLTLILLFASLAFGCHQSGLPSVAGNDVRPSKESVTRSTPPQTPLPVTTPTPRVEVRFGKGLRIVPKSVTLENEWSRYRIDIVYPQIEGIKSRQVSNLNRQIKDLVTARYRWPLSPPTQKDLRHYQKWPGVYNSVDLDYEVVLATDELLSLYLNAYHYGIGAAHSVQTSFTVNFDFKSGGLLKLTDLFKADTKSLGFISRYCTDELSKDSPYLFKETLTARAKNYESWNITKQGIRLNFDACKVDSCAAGEKRVEISFAAINDLLKSNGPLNPLLK